VVPAGYGYVEVQLIVTVVSAFCLLSNTSKL